jgi:putative ABC transport system permease protein
MPTVPSTCSLGVGANTAIFSLVNALFFVPLPIAEPARAVAVYTSDFSGPRYGGSSLPDFLDFRERSGAFEGLAAYSIQPFAIASDAGEPTRVWGELVSGEYFATLGLFPARGRALRPEDERG